MNKKQYCREQRETRTGRREDNGKTNSWGEKNTKLKKNKHPSNNEMHFIFKKKMGETLLEL